MRKASTGVGFNELNCCNYVKETGQFTGIQYNEAKKTLEKCQKIYKRGKKVQNRPLFFGFTPTSG
jgi:hypothetical protein